MRQTLKFNLFLFSTLLIIISFNGKLHSQNFVDSYIDIEGASNGICKWVDVNGDNYLDIFISGSNSLTKQAFCTIYLNQSGTHFIPSNFNFPPISYGAADWGDYDNDGDLDLLLIGTLGQNQGNPICTIYRNDMPEGFSQVSFSFKGVYMGTANWIDIDNDGDLDIITTGLDGSNTITSNLYVNNRGIFQEETSTLIPVYGGSATICDVDKDQDMDIILSGKRTLNPAGGDLKTSIFLNTYKGIFKEVDAGLPGVFESCIAWGDYDSDGKSDILLSGTKEFIQGSNPNSMTRIYRNLGNLNFTHSEANIIGVHKGIGIWGDCDNDGNLDVLLSGGVTVGKFTNPYNRITKIYLNRSNNFVELSNTPFVNLINTSGAWGDYDNDNDLDIIIAGMDTKNSDVTRVYINNSDIPNFVPIEPKGLTTSIDNGVDNFISLQWLPGFDDNSSSKSLTYNIRVGTTPGGRDIVSPSVNESSGYLQIPTRGNADNNTSWRLHNLPKGTYYWSVQSIDNSFSGSRFSAEQSFTISKTVGIIQINNNAPDKFELNQNYPNPFNPSTKIRYSLPGKTSVKLFVYNSTGQKIAGLVNQTQTTGIYEVTWSGKTDNGNSLSSGIYFYTIETEFGKESKKMLLIK